MHEGAERDEIARLAVDDRMRLVGGAPAVGVPPGALEGPAREGSRPRIGRRHTVPGFARNVVKVARDHPDRAVRGPRSRLGGVLEAERTRTGRLLAEGDHGHLLRGYHRVAIWL